MILIACRSTSSRFPRKHFAPLGGSTLLDVLISRVCLSGLPFAFVIPVGDDLGPALRSRGIEVFEGPEMDVLGRYAQAMAHYQLRWCIRVTGDCPLISPQDLYCMASICTSKGIDFGTNAMKAPTDGQEIEFISRGLMDYMNEKAELDEREHVTRHAVIWRRGLSNYFRYYDAPIQYGWQASPKLSVDTPEDLERVDLIMKAVEHGMA